MKIEAIIDWIEYGELIHPIDYLTNKLEILFDWIESRVLIIPVEFKTTHYFPTKVLPVKVNRLEGIV